MPLEAKDYITFTFGGAAFVLSIYNLVRARLEMLSSNHRTFEQNRFEAAATVAEIMDRFARLEGGLETLRFEALRSGNSAVIAAAEKHIDSARSNRSSYASIFSENRSLPDSSGSSKDLLEIEKQLGRLKAQKASVSEFEALVANFIEGGRHLILAESPAPEAPSAP